MIDNIKSYLYGHNYFIMIQNKIRFKNLLRGFVLKDWINAEEYYNKFLIQNQIIVQEYVKHYYNCWQLRNYVYYDRDYQRQVLQEWYKGMQEELNQSVDYQLHSFAIEHRNKYMREWLRCASEIKKIKIKFKGKLIKKYFLSKSIVLRKKKKENIKWKELSKEESYSKSEDSMKSKSNENRD